ncbi:MAG: hypothetical protein HQL19_07030 [Candidatus Omnitrophica bacterium]|nr:hypothetical protein [Candidatus Omnitrophota bacterium]
MVIAMGVKNGNTFLRFLIVSLLAFLFFAGWRAAGAQAQNPRRVLVLQSFHHGYIWTDSVQQGIDDAFCRGAPSVETYPVFMDLKRIPYSDGHILRFKDWLHESYKNISFDVIFASDNDAFEFLRKYRDELFPKVPVVFSAINDFDVSMLDGRKDVTGIPENTDYTGTIDLVLKLRPAARTVVVVTDHTTTGLAHASAVKKIEAIFSSRVQFQYWSLGDYIHEELSQKLSRLLIKKKYRGFDG